jgi:hypothetical protein
MSHESYCRVVVKLYCIVLTSFTVLSLIEGIQSRSEAEEATFSK